MRRALKYLVAFLGLVVVAFIAAVLLIPRERVVALAADQVRAATGRELTLAGELSPSLWPVLGVRTGPVTLSNAAWGAAEHMVSASAAEIGVELVALLSGEIKVTTLRLVDPVVALEIGGDGRANWVFGDGTGPQGGSSGQTPGELPKISLPEAVITNGRISFHDARSGRRLELAALDLTAGLAGLDKPLKLVGSGLWNGERAEFEAFIDTPAAAMGGGRTSVRVSLASGPASFSFEGDLQLAEDAALPLIDGRITADLPSPSAAIAWATGARAPDGLAGLGAVKLDGSVTATEAALRLAVTGSAGYRSRTVNFDLKADGAEGWLDRQAFAVAASGGSDGLFRFSFSGPVSGLASGSGALAAKGPLKLNVSDLRGLAKWAGGAALDAPAGVLESASLDARLTLRGADRIDLSGLTLRLDRTTMTGDAGVNLSGARPMITARLNSGPLDLSPFIGGGRGGAGGGGAPGPGWSTAPLDLSALRAVDAQVAIRAEAVDLGDIEIGRSDIDARLRNARLDLKIDRVDAYGGAITGTIMLLAGAEAQLSTDLTISAVRLRPLLNALAGFDRLEGLGAFRIRLDGRGRSMDALMKSLDGQGALELTDGAILGLNLAAMARNLTGQGGARQRTDFSAVSGTFDITDGVAHNTDFLFLGPLLRVIGAGTVDIGRQAQNFRLEPTAVASLTGQGGALDQAGLGVFPILVTGTWSNPSFRPDLTAVIGGLLSDPERTLEAVAGLVDGTDPAQAAEALLGAVTGGENSPAGALGQVLGGVIGGRSDGGGSGGGDGGAAGNQAGALGGLLGGLGGGQDQRQNGDGSVAQPRYGGDQPAADTTRPVLGALTGGAGEPDAGSVAQPTHGGAQPAPGPAEPEIDASALAPVHAPRPVPAAGNREALAALPGLPTSGAPSGAEDAVDDGLSVPSPQYTPAPEPDPPAATVWPEPAPEPVPTPEIVLQPEPEPEPLAPEPKAERRATGSDADERPRKHRDKDGGPSPGRIRKGAKK